uniref:non-specific serine/threonine protein kinase n=1 Tax=Hucho hucho TaxID=62062 RepID=A0A4W5L1C3_9TELE
MDSVSEKGGKMVESDEQSERDSGGGAAMAALHQCELIQNMIEISISSLQGLRTKCAASNDLTQQEIRTLEVKLMKYICKQLQCKQKVPETERPQALDSYPRLGDWLRTVNLRPELIEVGPRSLSLDALLQMPGSHMRETMRRLGSSLEECSRLSAALSCLKSATESGGCLAGWQAVSVCPSLGESAHGVYVYADSPLTDPFPLSAARQGRLHGHTSTPPLTPPSKRRHRLKPPCTPPPPSRKVLHLLPNITLTRSKSHESQLGNHNMGLHRGSPQAVRRDIGLAVTHRFSTKSWLSQTCQVCQKNMMFGVKCKHCRLKCHNKCTKEAPSCRISFLPITKIRRTESVPSDINNPVDRPLETPQFGTLPKAITKKDHPPALNQLDSSSNPSSTTSSTPSSPAPFQNPPSATPPPNSSPKVHRDNRFHFPAACYFQHRQQFIFPGEFTVRSQTDCCAALTPAHVPSPNEEEDDDDEDGGGSEMNGGSDGECDGDELDDLPNSRGGRWKGPISRKASQTSVYLQEWDIPFEQLDLGELIGKGRWGKVHKGRWHGEVAIRLLEIDGNNQDHLKLFKKEVMNYRQTRHENVVLFMGACMAPPHLAIITSFCKGRTLYSVVRDTKNTLDINKTRQIAQEIVKGMGYLHAKGIVHKDLKSKNVFHDTNKVIITDFGLFGISGVVQEGRRDNELKLPHGWICYLAPEIVRRMSPGNNEDRLPFSNAADVYAFGTIWYELQARDWPITNQPVEATIWQVGSGEGIKKVLAEISLGKEVTEILSACWAYDLRERPTFTQLADMLEKLPKLNRRLSHPGHFWKSADSSELSVVQKSGPLFHVEVFTCLLYCTGLILS